MLDRLWLIVLLLAHPVVFPGAGLMAQSGPCGPAPAAVGCAGCPCGSACGCAAEESDPPRASHEAIPTRSAEMLPIGALPAREAVWSMHPPSPAIPEAVVRGEPVGRVLALLCVWRT